MANKLVRAKTPAARVYRIAKGLTQREALARVRRLDAPRDFRGFKYNARTGSAAIV